MTVDTNKKFTVVTQFIKGSDGQLSEIKRFYVQGGKTIPQPDSTIDGTSGNSINAAFCKAQKVAFGDRDVFNEKGGFSQFSKAISTPMVLVMSLWDDHYANMLWLDSSYPIAKAGQPGADRGTCDTSSGVPADVESKQASNQVTYCESSCPLVSSLGCYEMGEKGAGWLTLDKQRTSSSAPSTRPSSSKNWSAVLLLPAARPILLPVCGSRVRVCDDPVEREMIRVF